MAAVGSEQPLEEQPQIVQDPLILTTPMYDMTKYEPLGPVLVNFVYTVGVLTGFKSLFTQFTGKQNRSFQTFMDDFQAAAHQYFMIALKDKYPDNTVACVVDYKTNITVITLGSQGGTPFPCMSVSGTCLGLKGAKKGGGKSRRRRPRGKKSLQRRR